jgi:predicted ATPase/signal transduction histidine kinase/tRNA A-37 threonylcarbamoyl transferase component Bud32
MPADYSTSEIVLEDASALVTSSSREGRAVLLRRPAKEYPTSHELMRMRYGAAVSQSLDLPGVVKVLGVEKRGHILLVTMEDFGGLPLRRLLDERRFEVREALAIALQLAKTLGDLHRNHVVHRGLEPANIYVNTATGTVKIANFDIASRLTRDNPVTTSASRLEGNLAYISPEQTGRMNRAADYRTDMYSLGVTLYEMLTGKLPFTAGDPMALVHSHIAALPEAPHRVNPSIDAAVSAIVMKLLAKNAEDRYQSGYGLGADLKECDSQLKSAGTISEFVPGAHDIASDFQIPQKLYGREREKTELLAAFARVSEGAAEMLLLSGSSGLGKTALVSEIHRPTLERRGHFISGKFDQLHNIPHGAMIQAFQGLIRELLSESDKSIAVLRGSLLEALGSSGQVVIDVIPEVALIVGRQPPVPELAAAETQHRFNLVFRRFIGVFASKEHPLSIFLDDLQWADSASLGFLRLVLGDPSTHYLFLIGAYRGSEIQGSHPLLTVIEELRKGQAAVKELALRPLDPADVRRIIVDTLGCPDDEAARDLARLVSSRTEGNPFFVNQFLTSLNARKLFTFDPELGRWQWSLARIQEAGITDDVASLMAERIGLLPEASQRALRLASCIGTTFDLSTLALISERTRDEAAGDLWEPVQAGLLVPVGDEYKYIEASDIALSSDSGGPESRSIHYQFPHDRVREAAYALIDADVKQALHLQIGRLRLSRTPEADREAKIFEIVNQLDMSTALIDGAEERRELADLNLLAGRKAKGASAYELALRYLDVGRSLLGADAWETDHDLTFRLQRQRAECACLLGRLDEADEGFDEALLRAATVEEKAEIYSMKILLCMSRSDYEGMMRAGRAALALHGIIVPEADGLKAAIEVESATLKGRLQDRNIPDLVDLPEARDEQVKARARLISHTLINGAYVKPELFQLLSLYLVNQSIEHGLTPGAALGYVTYAMRLLATTDDHRSAHAVGRVAMALAERVDDVNFRARVAFFFGAYVNPWLQHVRSSFPILEQSAAGQLEAGSPHGSGVAAGQSTYLALLSGDELSALHDGAQRHLETHQRSGNMPVAVFFACFLRAIVLLTKGAIPEEQESVLGATALAARAVHPAVQMTLNLLGLIVAFLFEDHALALRMAAEGSARIQFVFGHVSETEFRFHRALLFAALAAVGTEDERAARRTTLGEDLIKLERWSAQCPENFAHKHLLATAEVARVAGDEVRAMALYDQAIEAATAHDFPHHQALANELAGRFHLAHGRRKIARAYLVDARYGYLRWGAAAKVAAMDAKYGDILPRDDRRATEGTSGAALDLLAVMKASQAISGEIVLGELVRKLMSTVVENAGAQRGLLVLKGDHEVIVEAGGEATADQILVSEAPIEGRSDVSLAIVRYVERTRESVVLGDAANAGQFRSDPYVSQVRPKSILCLPVIEQQKLVGILYLENNLVANAFTPERCKVLELLASQAAISLENARLYDTLENRVQVRTRELSTSNEELSRALARLKETQKQLIMQEKLASLGALTSGIAHEIKNPLNFINNFAELTVGLVDDLGSEVLSQKARLDPDSVAMIEEIVADLRQNAAKINEHGKRADSIVCAMLEHARSGVGERRDVDVNALLAEYGNLAYQGFRSQDSAFNVTIETSYDPTVGVMHIVPQEIGRVFLNLINNACYAARAQRLRLGERFSPTLRLTTRRAGDKVEIRVRDNGDGIPPAVREKIFNPFFTTKPAGEGTGLGLSISYEIVQSNGGTLAVDTVPGSFTEFVITLPQRMTS